MILEARLVAAKALFDLVGGLVEAGIGVVPAALGVQPHSRAQTQRAVGAIAGPLAGYDHMAADRSAEIPGDRRFNFFQDVLTQCFPDVEVLTRYPQGHRTPALPFQRGGRMRSPLSLATHAFPPPPSRSGAVDPARRPDRRGSVRSVEGPCQSSWQPIHFAMKIDFRPQPRRNCRVRRARASAPSSSCASRPTKGF